MCGNELTHLQFLLLCCSISFLFGEKLSQFTEFTLQCSSQPLHLLTSGLQWESQHTSTTGRTTPPVLDTLHHQYWTHCTPLLDTLHHQYWTHYTTSTGHTRIPCIPSSSVGFLLCLLSLLLVSSSVRLVLSLSLVPQH